MKKLVLVLAVAFTGVLNAQNVDETKSINKIVETFKSIDGMLLSTSKLDQLYSDLSELTFENEVLFTKVSYFDNQNYLDVYGYNNIFKTTNFLNDQKDKLVTVDIDLSNVTSPNRLKSSTQINISISYTNDLGALTQNHLLIYIRYGVIGWIHEYTDAPADAGS